MNSGTLYVISTPIGNLRDITLRAIDTLHSVDYVLSEDTRETQKLFTVYEVTKPQISYRDQNHDRVKDSILNLLAQGLNLALVSDSGTPVISDPGFKLINDVIKAGYPIVSIPGPSSVTASLSIAGIPTDKFTFLGFLPKTQSHKDKLLREFGALETTLVIFESPYRLNKLLHNIHAVLGDRYAVVMAELTKSHERVARGKISEILAKMSDNKIAGEYVILIAKEGYL
jgi:16S rRNA (cytidine1402-2'-O)-methyltransferase